MTEQTESRSGTERSYAVYKIKNGTVIDHVPHWKGYKVIDILHLIGNEGLVAVGFGLESKKFGKKDLLKIENRELTQNELNKIALVAKSATINIIENSKIKDKFTVCVPDVVNDLLRCKNVNCITNFEQVPTIFYSMSKNPLKIKCHYCETIIDETDVELL